MSFLIRYNPYLYSYHFSTYCFLLQEFCIHFVSTFKNMRKQSAFLPLKSCKESPKKLELKQMNNLKTARKAKGLTTTDAAKAMNVQRQTIANWERGMREPSIENLKALAKLYNVSIDYLTGNEEGITISKTEYEELMKAKEILIGIGNRQPNQGQK